MGWESLFCDALSLANSRALLGCLLSVAAVVSE